MSYVNLNAVLSDAQKNRYAIGAFNIVDYITAAAVIKAAVKQKSPVIIQTSVKTIKHFGYKALASWVSMLAEDASIPVVLHLDHCKDLDVIENCINSGWSSVMIDASSFPLDENIRMTKVVVEMAKKSNVTVEGEVGAIVGVEDDLFIEENENRLADVDSCLKYVNETGVDLLAPAIGTAHGVYRKKPMIEFDLIRELSERTKMPLAIHGGTGLSVDMFKKCIEYGGRKINISTNIKQIFRTSFEQYYKNNPDDYEPIGSIKYLEDQVFRNVEVYFDIFGSSGRV